MSKLYLVLAFHNHQPVGNFEHVIEECYRKSYLPFLETLLDHPGLKVVLHYSGNLLLWIQEKHPEAFDIIKTLTDSGRVELLSGGLYEPILSVLPERDRILQVTEMSKFIRKSLGYSPRGMWLAERVWEPQMPKSIAKAGIEYVPIDDYHFKLTGLEDDDLLGYYVTEDEGSELCVFPGSEKLRYMIPFRTVDEIISYFREIYMRGGHPLLTMADDGEKFGVWPNTYKHVYEERWLDKFLSSIERNSEWIETTTFGEYRSKFRPLGRTYLPTASYREMGEWTLPAKEGLEYERVLEELQRTIGDRAKQLLRGGIWRSFMVKYPEANHIHKRMFMISGKVHAAFKGDSKKRRDARTELWKGQCNDAYWHGVFGGLYLPHLRSALYRHLIRAESASAGILKARTTVVRNDFDCDGFDDLLVNTRHYAMAVTEKGGSISELSLYKQAVNICDIISRRPEAYHAKLSDASHSGHDETRTIHEMLSVKEAGLSDHLVYDSYRRASLIDRFFSVETAVGDIARSAHEELGDFVGGVYAMRSSQKGETFSLSLSRQGIAGQRRLAIEKTLTAAGPKKIKVEYTLTGAYSGLFAVEMNLSLLGSPHALIRRGAKMLTVRSTAVHENVKDFSVKDKYLDLVIDFAFNEGVVLWHYPVETVSLSEDGVERLYQGTCFLFIRNIDLQGRKKMWFTMSFGEDTK
ncbi:MAG: alpha-amylase/4-alpha-glucanotransferase domain-containing protein [Thermodesulfovibrionales bacterium]